MKSALRLIIVLGISVLFVWLSMRDVPVRTVWEALVAANWGGFLLVCVVTIFGFWLRAVRWRLFIQTDADLPTDSLFSATMIGFMANNVLPLRLGEFVRPWALSRREKHLEEHTARHGGRRACRRHAHAARDLRGRIADPPDLAETRPPAAWCRRVARCSWPSASVSPRS